MSGSASAGRGPVAALLTLLRRLVRIVAVAFGAKAPAVDMSGKTVLITGGNSGIGLETAVGLAGMGAKVVITARDETRGARAVDDIKQRSGNDDVHTLHLDLGSFVSVHTCAEVFLDRFDRLDVLINNAGATLSERQLSEDGIELQLQANHLSHFLLTHLLLDRLVAGRPARIVVVSSAAHRQGGDLDVDDLEASGKPYIGLQQYARTKLMNLLFANELARRLKGSGVTVNAVHPGTIRSGFGMGGDATGVFAVAIRIARPFFKSATTGAQTTIYVATSPEVAGESGGYYASMRPRGTSAVSRDEDLARRLWERSAALTGVSDAA